MIDDGDAQPICLCGNKDAGVRQEGLKRILLRAINKNQVLILNDLRANSAHTISSRLDRLSGKSKAALSTLRLNAKILKELGLIDYGDGSVATLTELGGLIHQIVSDSG